MKRIILLFCLTIGSVLPSSATHLMGGDITMQDLGNQQYQVTLIAYRDTVGVLMTTSANIEFNGPSGQSFNLSVPYSSFISGTLLPMYPYGVEVYLFMDTITLAESGSWEISWQNCCRNGAIQNIANPLSQSMYLTTTVVTDSLVPNSTPFFLVPAAIFLPNNTPWQYNPLPFDPDGDSLYWSIDQPLNSLATNCPGYVTPSSDPTNVFSIDPITGTISWTANTLGNFVASILVDQYRNGIWMGSIRRDMQFIVVTPTSGVPQWKSLSNLPTDINGNYLLDVPADIPFHLEMVAEHTTPGKPVYMGAFSEIFQNPQSNATFVENVGVLETKGTFDWMPSGSDIRANPYHLVFRISDKLLTDDKTILLNVATALSLEENNDKSFKVYPNPTSGKLFLSLENNNDIDYSLNVYNIAGQQILKDEALNTVSGINMFVIETNSWKSGTYIVSVSDNNGSIQNEIVVVE